MSAHARFKNEFTEDEQFHQIKYPHNLLLCPQLTAQLDTNPGTYRMAAGPAPHAG